MRGKLKERKCKKCRAEFQPKTEWQKYCSRRCRAAVYHAERTALIRRALKIIEAQEAERGEKVA